MTQLIQAKKGNITKEMQDVAKEEGVSIEILVENITKGFVVIPKNKNRKNVKSLGVGKGLKTKINANIGTSKDCENIDFEIQKAYVALKAGADAIMDLSTGNKSINPLRRKIINEIPIALGTVPMYEAVVRALEKRGSTEKLTGDDLFDVIEGQAKEGVDFITVHCGVNKNSVERFTKQGRIASMVSRGGALLARWIMLNGKENPLYEDYDRLLEIAKKYDVTLSLGDGLRPGALADSTDRAQIQELIILGELQKRALDYGVQVMIEGPGHVPFNEIETNIILQKKLCNGAPFYVLGPLVTDSAAGYDHITAAIGGTAAAAAGADFLCYVTPSEHLRLPTIKDVEEGVIATRIAAHAGDIAKGRAASIELDRKMSIARKKRDWEAQFNLCLFPEAARAMRAESKPKEDDVCTMCSELCAIKALDDIGEYGVTVSGCHGVTE